MSSQSNAEAAHDASTDVHGIPVDFFDVAVGSDQSLDLAIAQLIVRQPELESSVEVVLSGGTNEALDLLERVEENLEILDDASVNTGELHLSEDADLSSGVDDDTALQLADESSDAGDASVISATAEIGSSGFGRSVREGALLRALGGRLSYSGQLAITHFRCRSSGCVPVSTVILDQDWDQGYTTVRVESKAINIPGWSLRRADAVCYRSNGASCTNANWLLNTSNAPQVRSFPQIPSNRIRASWTVRFTATYGGVSGQVVGATPPFLCDSLSTVCKWQY